MHSKTPNTSKDASFDSAHDALTMVRLYRMTMTTFAPPVSDPIRTNFTSLCEETLAVIAPVLAGLGYVSLALIHNTDAGRKLPLTASLGAIVLIACGIGAFVLRQRCQTVAIGLAVWGAFVAALLAVASLRIPMATYLLIVPVVLANSLLRRKLVLVADCVRAHDDFVCRTSMVGPAHRGRCVVARRRAVYRHDHCLDGLAQFANHV